MANLTSNDTFKDRGLVKLTDGDRAFAMDTTTHAFTMITYEHHEVHGGSSFTCHYTQTVSDTDDRSIIAFKTPNTTKYLHITASASATAVATAKVTEAPTITDNEGTTLAVYNRRRVGTPTATTIIDTSQNPTAGSAMYFSETDMGEVTGGPELATIPLGAASTGLASPVGGMARATQEWILKPNTLYAFEVISLSDADNTHWLELDWYEHTDKD